MSDFVKKENSSNVRTKLKYSFITEDYSADILECLKVCEKERPENLRKSPDLRNRHHYIKFMKSLAKEFKFTNLTLHLGIYLLDIFMDSYYLSDSSDHKKLVFAVILVLAAKSEEIDNVPSIPELTRYVDVGEIIDLGKIQQFKYSKIPEEIVALRYEWRKLSDFYGKLELIIFQSVGFNVIRPTVATFVNYFLLYAVNQQDFDTSPADSEFDFETFGDMEHQVNKTILDFLDLSLYNVDTCSAVLPSLIASAVILAARIHFKLKIHWTAELEHLTGQKYNDIINYALILIRFKTFRVEEIETPENEDTSMDQGYDSQMNSNSDESYGSEESFETDESCPSDSKRPRLD